MSGVGACRRCTPRAAPDRPTWKESVRNHDVATYDGTSGYDKMSAYSMRAVP
jgi:hypothetical protein